MNVAPSSGNKIVPFKINLMEGASQLEVQYRSVEPEQPKDTPTFNLMRAPSDESIDGSSGEESITAPQQVNSQIQVDQEYLRKDEQPSPKGSRHTLETSDPYKNLHESHFVTKAMPESLRAKIKDKLPFTSTQNEKLPSGKKSGSILKKLGNLIVNSISPKRSSNEYTSLEKPVHDNQIMVEVHSPRKIDSNLPHEDDDQAAEVDQDELQMAALMTFLEELGPEVKEQFLMKMMALGQVQDITRSQFNEEVNKWFLQMQQQGVILQPEVFESITSIFRPMSRLFNSFRNVAESDVQRFSQAFRTAMQNYSDRKSPSLFLNPKFIPIKDKISKRLSIRTLTKASIPIEFVQAKDAISIYLKQILKECNQRTDASQDIALFERLTNSLESTRDLFFNNSLKERNYIVRDKLLYKPVIKLVVPKPIQPIVYYWREYVPFNEKSSYGWAQLVNPLKKAVQKLNLFRRSKKIEETDENKAIIVELTSSQYEEFISLTLKSGLLCSLKEFSQEEIIKRYENSFNNMEDKSNIQKLPSHFCLNFLKQSLIPSSFLNFDLNMYKVYISVVDSILKFHCLTLLCKIY